MTKKVYNSPILQLFFDYPETGFHIREIARQIEKHPNTVLKDVHLLEKEGLLHIKATRAIVQVTANRDSKLFIRLKRISNLRAIYLSGIVDFLHKEYGAPKAIILFGSYSRGEDTKRSDIDIAIITSHNISTKLTKYESSLKRTIQLHKIDLKKASKEFTTNLANGIVLEGYLDYEEF